MTPEQEKMLREVHEAVIGNQNTDTTGLIKRVKSLEQFRADVRKLQYKIAGGLFVLAAIWEFIKHKLGI